MVDILKNSPSDFSNLKNWDYEENFYNLETEYGELRIHYIDEGKENDKTVFLLHGEPDWGYIYRKFVNPLVESGLRVVVPDLPGFGKSDKLSDRNAYTYEKYVTWLSDWLVAVDLVCELIWVRLEGKMILACDECKKEVEVAK